MHKVTDKSIQQKQRDKMYGPSTEVLKSNEGLLSDVTAYPVIDKRNH